MGPHFRQVPGFEWTQPRQVSPAELSRNDRGEEDSGRSRDRWAGEESADKDAANSGRRRNSELALETIPCHNSASQIFYLSVEASTPRVRDGERERKDPPHFHASHVMRRKRRSFIFLMHALSSFPIIIDFHAMPCHSVLLFHVLCMTFRNRKVRSFVILDFHTALRFVSQCVHLSRVTLFALAATVLFLLSHDSS